MPNRETHRLYLAGAESPCALTAQRVLSNNQKYLFDSKPLKDRIARIPASRS
jgi:hypothetical protein